MRTHIEEGQRVATRWLLVVFGWLWKQPDTTPPVIETPAEFLPESLGRRRTVDHALLPVEIVGLRKYEDSDGDATLRVDLAGCDRALILDSADDLLVRRRFDKQTVVQLGRWFAPTTEAEWREIVDAALAKYVRHEEASE
jgi:hypothetical protein